MSTINSNTVIFYYNWYGTILYRNHEVWIVLQAGVGPSARPGGSGGREAW